jgi:hypothetical protein
VDLVFHSGVVPSRAVTRQLSLSKMLTRPIYAESKFTWHKIRWRLQASTKNRWGSGGMRQQGMILHPVIFATSSKPSSTYGPNMGAWSSNLSTGLAGAPPAATLSVEKRKHVDFGSGSTQWLVVCSLACFKGGQDNPISAIFTGENDFTNENSFERRAAADW